MDTMQENNKSISLKQLLIVFLKVGAISFGGNIALVSMVQKELVEKYKVVSNEFFLNAISVASLLPGPMAVNVVAFTGYHLKNKKGALLGILAVLLPSLILMVALSWLYFNSSAKLQIGNLMNYIIGSVCGIILSVGVTMFKKEVAGNNYKIIVTVLATILLYFFNSYLFTIIAFIAGGIIGYFFERPLKKEKHHNKSIQIKPARSRWFVFTVLILTQMLFASKSVFLIKNLYLKIFFVFGGISLSLFGGGYVMIPIMQTLFVNDLHWVSTKEFIDAIAFSQVTPGPILVSATFIGYKLAGIAGALIATAGIFLPSAVLMILMASLLQKNKDNYILKSIMSGIKNVVIAMIIVASFKILKAEAIGSILTISLFILSFLLSYFKKVNPVYLVLSSIAIGIAALYF